MKERETVTGTATAAATLCAVTTTAMGDPDLMTAVNSHQAVAAGVGVGRRGGCVEEACFKLKENKHFVNHF